MSRDVLGERSAVKTTDISQLVWPRKCLSVSARCWWCWVLADFCGVQASSVVCVRVCVRCGRNWRRRQPGSATIAAFSDMRVVCRANDDEDDDDDGDVMTVTHTHDDDVKLGGGLAALHYRPVRLTSPLAFRLHFLHCIC